MMAISLSIIIPVIQELVKEIFVGSILLMNLMERKVLTSHIVDKKMRIVNENLFRFYYM